MTAEGAHKRVKELFGLDDEQAGAFIEKLLAETGNFAFSDTIFLFHCLKFQQEQIEELRRKLLYANRVY